MLRLFVAAIVALCWTVETRGQSMRIPANRVELACVHWGEEPVWRDVTAKMQTGAAKFGQRLYVVARKKSAAGVSYLQIADEGDVVGETDDDRTVKKSLGWIRESACLVIQEGRFFSALENPKTHVHQKCMLMNSLAGTSQDFSDQTVDFYARPDRNSSKTVTKNLFEIFFIFAEETGANGSWYMVGIDPKCSWNKADRGSFIGWIPASRVTRWDTREAIEFNSRDRAIRTRPAVIFESREELERYMKSKIPLGAGEIEKNFRTISIEDLTKNVSLKHYQPRFPILSGDGDVTDELSVSSQRIYEIGVIGNVRGTNISAEYVARFQDVESSMRASHGDIQVAFVVDQTFSMRSWSERLTRIIDSFEEAAKKAYDKIGSKPRPSFAVVTYREGGVGAGPVKVHPFGSAREARSILKNTAFVGGDERSRVFQALQQTVTELKWNEDGVRLVVLLGDSGNEQGDKTHSTDTVVRAFQQKAGVFPFSLMAIRAGGRLQPSFERDLGAIVKKLKDIFETGFRERQSRLNVGPQFTDASLNVLLPLIGSLELGNDSTQLAKAVESRLLQLLREVQFRTNPDESDAYGLAFSQLVYQQIEEKGFGDIVKAKGKVQLFQRGWIAEVDLHEPSKNKNGLRPMQIQHMAFFNYPEVEKTQRFLAHIDTLRGRKVEEVWLSVAETLVGEDISLDEARARFGEASLQQMLKEHLGLTTQLGITKLKFNELASMTPQQRNKHLKELQLKALQLTDVISGRVAKYEYKAGAQRWEALSEEPKEYWFPKNTTKGQKVWLDREFLP